jgi:hypothetical protein
MVGGGGATTLGLNLLPPLGLRDFSVGNTGALLDDGVGVDGACVPLLPHPAASELTARSVAAQAVTAVRRPKKTWFTVFPFADQRRDTSPRKFRSAWRSFADPAQHVTLTSVGQPSEPRKSFAGRRQPETADDGFHAHADTRTSRRSLVGRWMSAPKTRPRQGERR